MGALPRIRRMATPWTAEEEALLAELVPCLLHEEIGALLGRSLNVVRHKAKSLRLLKKSPDISDVELQLVDELMEFLPYAEIGRLIGRSGSAVQQMTKRYLGKRRPPRAVRWTPDDLATLRTLYPLHRNADIAIVLDRSLWAVNQAAFRLGLRKPSVGRWIPLVPQALRDAIALTQQLKEKAHEREQRENDRRSARRTVSSTRHP